jgi:hypothetical protein|tara:strand:- start:444 stop:656 length:213 start_codon:yes stop_codon:yes gene_type:complete
MNYDDWKLSPPDGDELLSPCCGCTYTETDESYECDSCKEEFDEPIVDYEYRARIEDDRAEAMMEDRRLGL